MRACASSPWKRAVMGAAMASGLLVDVAAATYHFMQIEQVIGGVNGDRSAQAIQLRMRTSGQREIHISRLVAWDAAGQNPIVLIAFDRDVSLGNIGSRILIASSQFASYTSPAVTPDFTMAQLIPPSYLAAGSLTFETDEDAFSLWRLSWGGSGYTGTTIASMVNDVNGEFGPPFPDGLPWEGLEALQFTRSASSESSNNANDYARTADAAIFVNNAGAAFTVTSVNCSEPDDTDGDGSPDCLDDCPDDQDKIEQGVCGCGEPDSDTDGDGILDCQDGCPGDAAKNAPGICGCDQSDNDRDADGTVDCFDLCPDDPLKTARGPCGCGAIDTDSDGDSLPDCVDGCPNDPAKSAAGACGCGSPDTDANDNGAADCTEQDDIPNSGGGGGGGGGTPPAGACASGIAGAALLSLASLMLCRLGHRRAFHLR